MHLSIQVSQPFDDEITATHGADAVDGESARIKSRRRD